MRLNYFNFKRFNDAFLLTNDMGQYVFISPSEFDDLIHNRLHEDSETARKLLSCNMIYNESMLDFSLKNFSALRSIKSSLASATSLHIFVVTTACNLRCVYCQANNGSEQPCAFMTAEIAEKAVDLALQSPEKYLSFEFQGGEPLLNFPVIKHIIEYAESRKGDHCIDFNIVSNLTLLNEDILAYLKEHDVKISTSVDGGEAVHNANRPFPDSKGSFHEVCKAVRLMHEKGFHVGAIETTTRAAFGSSKELIDAYLNLGFDSIFIRPLTPLGKALRSWDEIGYSAEEFVKYYSEVLDRIIEINKNGQYLREEHAAIMLKKVFGYGINYMELRSPCGAGIGQLAYFADGKVFTCDEGRMMYEMGADDFFLGDVFTSRYNDLIQNNTCKAVCASSILESIPSCCDCVYQPYCGTCPVVTFAATHDIIEKKPHEYKCRVYSGIFDLIFGMLRKEDPDIIRVFESWIH